MDLLEIQEYSIEIIESLIANEDVTGTGQRHQE